MVHLCTPYDDGITCLCDESLDVNILKLVPTKKMKLDGEIRKTFNVYFRCFLSRESVASHSRYIESDTHHPVDPTIVNRCDTMPVDIFSITCHLLRSSECPERGLDSKVEIILAAAILSLIVLLFTW